MASFRYRAMIPARELGVDVNNFHAHILIYAKPQNQELDLPDRGQLMVADFCDDHFSSMPHYHKFLEVADEITCPTLEMQKIIKKHGRDATIIEDPYEYEEKYPHCDGSRLLWFGHKVNYHSLKRILPEISEYSLRIVSNIEGCIAWSPISLLSELRDADIVILPATAGYKSPNRAVESIRNGCMVVAEDHPSLEDFPIWKGNIREGIEWTKTHLKEANEMIREAQSFVRERFSPRTQADAWRKVLEPYTHWGPEGSNGKDGSPLILPTPTSIVTSVN